MRSTLAHDSALWRRLAYAGARYGPDFWLKYSPAAFGVAAALALPKQRQKVRDTLRWVQGETGTWHEQRKLFATFIQYAHCLAESLAAGRPEAENATCHVQGEQHLHAVLGQRRGALIVTAHAGPWDGAARHLRATHGREVVVVMESEADRRARELHDRVRTRSGVRIVHVGRHPLDALPLLRELNAGTLVAAQLDRGAPSGRGIATELFGRELMVPEGPFRLAALSRVPILPLFAERVGHFHYNLVVYPGIELGRNAGSRELREAAQTATNAMAAFIARAPTQWFNF